MSRPAPVHYLRKNEREWTPRSVIFLDTETRASMRGTDEILALRLWCARITDRRPDRAGHYDTADGSGHTAAQLVDWVNREVSARGTVWLLCHNLAFDLTTTRLPVALAALGWNITDAAVGGKSPWMRMAKGRSRLCLVDSGSWLPTSLADVGERIGLPKPPLPSDDDGEAEWLNRCWADVNILDTAMTSLMDWWDSGKLGNWTISGPGCGWNSYRHIPTFQRPVIDPDPLLQEADRGAIYGGRRGVWRVGEQNAGPFLELDLVAAYPTVAAELPLPTKRRRGFESLAIDDRLIGSDRWGVIAECTIDTNVPRFPVKLDGKTWYPVGQFRTTLAGPDVAEARRLGCLVSIGPGHVHQLGSHMQPWARWCLDVQAGNDPDAPAAAQITAKHWGRAVIGKWAAHGFVKTELGPSPIDGWSYEEGFDHATQSRGGMLDLAGRRWWVHAGGPSENAYPGVLAWVESETRIRLSRAIEAIGQAAVVQCDTDGLVVAGRLIGTPASGGHLIAPPGLGLRARINWVLDNINPVTAPLELRLKRQSRSVHVHGPQHMRLDGQRRLAGMPRGAIETEPNTFVARTWPKLTWQMKHGSPAGYVRPEVTRHLQATYPTGWVTDRNLVLAPECHISADDVTRFTPWPLTQAAQEGHRLTEVQHPVLDGYR